MPEALPSLGWLILAWAHHFLPSPSDESQPFVLTDEQARLVVDWYTVDPSGHFVYRRAILEMAKGWGKSPLAALLALAEFCGPVVFDGWAAGGERTEWGYVYQPGEPMGRPWGTKGSPPALVQIAAVSEDQTENTYGAIYQMLTAREGAIAASLGINNGRTRLYLKDRPGELHPVTASAGSREGQRLTFAVMDETHLWKKENGGIKLAATLRRNAAKMNGRTIETTNAPTIGEKSVAEKSGNDATRHPGILHHATRPLEPSQDADDETLLAALNVAYGDASWIDKQRLLRDIRDPSTDWDDALRYYFNIRVAGSGKAVDPKTWDALARPITVEPNTEVGVGFDGSINNDETWLTVCTRDGYSFPFARWSRPAGAPDDWTVPRHEVHAAVERLFATFRVGRMNCDPAKWWTEIEQWQARYGKDSEDKFIVRAFDTNSARRFAPAVDRWRTAIREGSHTHDGDPVLAEHVKALHLKKVRLADADDDGRTHYVVIKGEDRRKIDGGVSDILAFDAAMSMPALPVPKAKTLVFSR